MQNNFIKFITIVLSPFIALLILIVVIEPSTIGRIGFSDDVALGKVLSINDNFVTYGYNVPKFKRQDWTYQRQQKISKDKLSNFQLGMDIDVEFPSIMPGASRIKGTGRSNSAFIDELGQNLLIILVCFTFLALLSVKRKKSDEA